MGHLDPHRCRKILAGLGIPRVEVLGDAELHDRVDRGGHVHQREPAHLGVGGQDCRRRTLFLAASVALDDDRVARASAARDLDDVPGAEVLQADRNLGPSTRRSGFGGFLLDVANLVAQRGIRGVVPQMAGHRLGVTSQCLLIAPEGHGHADDGAVGLELRERGLQNVAGRLASKLPDEVDRHVVGRPKAGPKRIGARRCQTAHRKGVKTPVVQHDGVALDVNAASSRASRQLGVLSRRDVSVRLAVELHQPLQNHGPCRHVDAQGQRLGGEHRTDTARSEELLDDLPERRQHPGMVGRETAGEALDEVPVAQHAKVLVGQALDAFLDRATDPVPLHLRYQPNAAGEQLAHG